MASYDFQTISAAQALAYSGATDSLFAWNPLRDFAVQFDDQTRQVTLTDGVSGRAVTFGAGIYGARVLGPGGDALRLGSPEADYANAARTIRAGAGDDLITDAIYAFGGLGRDTFIATYGSRIEQILDWESGDRLYMSSVAPNAANYAEGAKGDSTAALLFAQDQIRGGASYVSVAVGQDVLVFADYLNQHDGLAMSQTTLVGRGLGDISWTDFVGGPAPRDPALPPAPQLPQNSGVRGTISGNIDSQHLSTLLGAAITEATPNGLTLKTADLSLTLLGSNLVYDGASQLVGGVVNSIFYASSQFNLTLAVKSVPAGLFSPWVAGSQTQQAFETLFTGNDQIGGSQTNDLIRGYGGDDVLYGGGGSDSLFGGAGNDVISAKDPIGAVISTYAGPTYLRGEAGDDFIIGGALFDDIHGNMGNDTARGGDGGDWVVGGQGNDLLYGDAGDDIVYGNLGNDTAYGGEGADTVRGGQADDLLYGGAGDDWLAGDRGDDTIWGGTGADTFYIFGEAGLDRVMDFNRAEGDRVLIDRGTAYSTAQVGADTVISISGGAQMVLVGVSQASLEPGWIVLA